LKRLLRTLALFTFLLQLYGCGTLFATVPNAKGDPVMLLGYDPVAYFTQGQATRGVANITHTLSHPQRTYYFSTEQHKTLFVASPQKYEPQYGAFCANGAAYGVKLGSDPSEFMLVEGRLFIFGDILGREMWKLFQAEHIRYADQLWPEIRDLGWRYATLKGYVNKVPWYRTGAQFKEEFDKQHPNKPLSYDPGGMLANLFFKLPGWRAAEGFGQPALGYPQ
jgi:hypothetical protein